MRIAMRASPPRARLGRLEIVRLSGSWREEVAGPDGTDQLETPATLILSCLG